MMGSMMAGMGLWGLVLIVALLGVLTAAVLGGRWLVRGRSNPQTQALTTTSDPARDTLRRRYAAGEIDDEEYERRLSALTYWQ